MIVHGSDGAPVSAWLMAPFLFFGAVSLLTFVVGLFWPKR